MHSPSKESLKRGAELKYYLQLTRKDKSQQHRRVVLEICEDLFLLDPSYAKSLSLDELVWKAVFYDRFEELKGTPVLLPELSVGVSYYQMIILQLQSHFEIDLNTLGLNLLQKVENNHADIVRLDALTIIYKSLVYLGDLARYQMQISESVLKNWNASKSWYEKAFVANPRGGKPHGQIALLSSQQNDSLDTLYFYCLRYSMPNRSIGNIETTPQLRRNFHLHLAKFSQAQNFMELTTDYELSNSLLGLFSSMFPLADVNLEQVQQQVTTMCKYIETATVSGSILRKLSISLIILTDELNSQFSSAATATIKQNIRSVQVCTMSLLFTISNRCLQLLTRPMDFSPLEVDLYLFTASIFSSWMHFNDRSMILNYMKYGHVLSSIFYDVNDL
jgi:Est1 DNA/RNA binding domain/Telomerase activating protein Est1